MNKQLKEAMRLAKTRANLEGASCRVYRRKVPVPTKYVLRGGSESGPENSSLVGVVEPL